MEITAKQFEQSFKVLAAQFRLPADIRALLDLAFGRGQGVPSALLAVPSEFGAPAGPAR
jgi:hypothetical protein